MEFWLDPRSGVATYLQIVRQVRQALRMGTLARGDQLPTVKDVVGVLAINPNTVLKAYRELERDGLVEARPGMGTFVVGTLPGVAPAEHAKLRSALVGWLRSARGAGLDEETIEALFTTTFREETSKEEIA